MAVIQGMIFDIKRYAINDGPGIRTAVFFKGCPLECWWCHNPEGQSTHPQLIFRNNRCMALKDCLHACPKGAIDWSDGPEIQWELCNDCGKCAEVCSAGALEMVGRSVSTSELMVEIERDIPFYDQSGGGVTFTGGEPMLQQKFLKELLLSCKEKDIHTALDTSGYTSSDGFVAILPLVDLFLYDIKIMDESRHQKYTSVPNQLILENLKRLSGSGAHLIVRIPVIPGINDDKENLAQSGFFLAALPHLEGVELMPYHEIGLAKYQGLGKQYRMQGIKPPSKERIEELESILSNYQLPLVNHYPGRSI